MLTRMLNRSRIFIIALALFLCAQAAFAQGSVFTYQGKLTDAGNPANGAYEMQFKLFDTADVGTGAQQGDTVALPTVQVSAGIFTVPLDFTAAVFNGEPRYLEISVRPAGKAEPFTVLAPRQPLTSTPYAVRSLNSVAADGLSVACVNCVTSSQIASVEGTQVTGAIPVESVPTGSGNYIQNAAPLQKAGKNAVQQAASFNVDGDGTSGGTLSGNVVNTTTQYNIGGNKVLSLGSGSTNSPLGGALDNLFLGLMAGEGNTTGSQNSFFGRASGIGNTTGFDNSAFGAYSGGQVNMTGSANSFFGVSAGFNTSTGSANMFFGRSSGFQNTTGADNSFFGVQAGRDSSTGSQNSFFGRASGIGNTTGFDNSSFGAYSGGQVNMTGGANSYFGVSAGFNTSTGNANAFFGRSAGFQNTTGFSNSFFGTQAGRDNSTGVDNSFFGRVAGIGNLTGSNNTILGSNANVGANNLFNATAIGANALVSQNDSLVLGSSNVKVGIGTSAPQFKLHVEAAGIVETNVRSTNERAILALDSTVAGQRRVWTLESGFGNNPGLFAIYDRTATQPRLTIDAIGTVGVNVLQITGGGDFSENFDVSEASRTKAGALSKEVRRGLVVSIDSENPGKLVVSRRAYDRSVAGIISGAGGINPGLVMGQKGSIADGKQPVALTGRVWAYCDASTNPIKPGDLLTTSATPGHAMKAGNYRKAQGAIIGKAMTSLTGGRGLVLVLVSLQ
jgi:hypothetical protein